MLIVARLLLFYMLKSNYSDTCCNAAGLAKIGVEVKC